jgi:hypothetical protein
MASDETARKRRLPSPARLRALALRWFLIYCGVYTLTSVLFDHWGTRYTGLSETTCFPQFIGAESEDELKQRLVDIFAPTLVFSLGEPTNLEDEIVVPYQIVPDREEAGRYVWRGAVAYEIDYGASASSIRIGVGAEGQSFSLSKSVIRVLGSVFGFADVDAHYGDVEMFEVYLRPAEEEGYWEIDRLTLFRHGNAKDYPSSAIRCFRDSPILYVSRGKHAMYPSLQECNHASVTQRRGLHLIAEYCSIGELYYLTTSPEFDVGDSSNPVNIFETSPTILENEVFVGEDAWGDCFWGGHGEREGLLEKPCRARFRWW